MSEEEVLNIVIRVLETVINKHERKGRFEINRGDLAEVVGELKLVGLPALQKSTEDQIASFKK